MNLFNREYRARMFCAGQYAAAQPALAFGVGNIFRLRPDKKVLGVNTAGIVASVKYAHCRKYAIVRGGPCQAMREVDFPLPPNPPIAAFVERALPFQTAAWR